MFAAVAMLAMVVAAMLAVEIGRMYTSHRHLKKIAVVAALDAVRIASGCDRDIDGPQPAQSDIEAAVLSSLTQQGYGDLFAGAQVEPGVVRLSSAGYDRQLEAADVAEAQAVRVTLTRPFPAPFLPFFPTSGRVMTTSVTAERTALGSLQVGSGLLSVSTAQAALLNPLLSGLLGGAVNLSVIDYNGLASAQVTLAQVASAIGLDVIDLSDPLVLSTETPALSPLLNGLADALGGTVSSSVTTALGSLANAAASSGSRVPLGQLMGAVDDAGADAPFSSVLDLVVALGAAAQANSSGANPIALPVNLSVPGVATVNVFLRVLEPPQYSGMGRPGQTEARTAQLGLGVRIVAGQVLSGLATAIQGLINSTLGLLNLVGITSSVTVPSTLNLGIDLELAAARATLDQLQCPTRAHPDPAARLSAQSAPVSVAVGTFTGTGASMPPLSAYQNAFPVARVVVNASDGCIGVKLGNACIGVPVNLGSTDLNIALALTSLGVGSQSRQLDDVTEFTALAGDEAPAVFLANGAPGAPPAYPASSNPQQISSPVALSLNLGVTSQQTGSGLVGILGGLVSNVVGLVTSTVQPLLNLVNGLAASLIEPLLQLLGIQFGTATVTMMATTMDQPHVVSMEAVAAD